MASSPASHAPYLDVIAPPRVCVGRVRVRQGTGACRSLLISRGGLGRCATACKFLFFPRGATGTKLPHRRPVATQHSLVNINENTSAAGFACARVRTGNDCICLRNCGAETECSAAREQNINPEQARRVAAGTAKAALGPAPVGRLARTDPCRSLLIPCPRVERACRSLLIPAPGRPAEPVRSGGRPGCRHGHRPARRPPSRLLESGGRP